jgi:hypothetical protein
MRADIRASLHDATRSIALQMRTRMRAEGLFVLTLIENPTIRWSGQPGYKERAHGTRRHFDMALVLAI